MAGNRISVERVRFDTHETDVEAALEEYHREVADGLREYLAHHAAGHEFSPTVYVRDELAKDRSYLRENDSERPLVVAVDGEDVVGCVYLYDLTGGEGEVKRLYVRESHRSHGLGRRLVERLIRAAERDGYDSLRLDTAPYMKGAQHLYRDLGFTSYESGASITDVPEPLLDDLVFMRRSLDVR